MIKNTLVLLAMPTGKSIKKEKCCTQSITTWYIHSSKRVRVMVFNTTFNNISITEVFNATEFPYFTQIFRLKIRATDLFQKLRFLFKSKS